MTKAKNVIAALILAVFAGCLPLGSAAQAGGKVLVIVNDQPITDFDIDQRLKAAELMGDQPGSNPRKKVLQELVNDVLKQAEAKKLGALPSERQVDEAMNRMARGVGTDAAGLASRIKQKGLKLQDVRDQVAISIAFNRLLNAKYAIDPKVDSAEVDRRMAMFQNDPRMQAVSVYKIQEIQLPVENVGAMANELMMARAVEARQIMSRYNGCASAKTASRGIFNVKVGKVIEADGSRLPKPLKAALDKAGTKKLVGPIPAQGGIQLLGLCGTSKLAPTGPTRAQVENMIVNEKYASFEERYVKDLRRTAIIDYKDPSFKPSN
jgi:peptidyl-prolyl cis-trans isomerase SurA